MADGRISDAQLASAIRVYTDAQAIRLRMKYRPDDTSNNVLKALRELQERRALPQTERRE